MLPRHLTIGHPFIELQQVDSTNNYATALAHAGMAQHGTAVLAHHQTKGKGQRSRQWEAVAGENITTSIIIEPKELILTQMFLLSMTVAVGVYRFFNKYAEQDGSIKWPNDLYWRDRKAGGILIENLLQGTSWNYAIAGIGININQVQFADAAARPVSLKQITGKNYDVVTLAHELYRELETAFDHLYTNRQFIIDTYHQVLYKKGQPVRLKKDNRIFETVVTGVSPTGELITNRGIEERFGVGEVEWVF